MKKEQNTFFILKNGVSEPYRILFPIGLLLLLIGVGIWSIFFYHPELGYPAQAHVNILTKGVMTSFIFGFLLTMLPHRLAIPPIKPLPLLLMVTSLLSLTYFSLSQQYLYVSLSYFLLILIFDLFFLSRLKKIKVPVPSQFSFIVIAFICISISSLTQLLEQLGSIQNPWLIAFSKFIDQQGFTMLLIIGIGTFLFPKLFKMPAANREIPISFKSFFLPFAFASSYALDAYAYSSNVILYFILSNAIRLLISAWLFQRSIKIFQKPKGQPTYLKCIWVSLWFILLGNLLICLDPGRRIAWEHIIFITGYLWVTFLMISKVLTTHDQQYQRLIKHRWIPIFGGSCFILSMLARVGPDLALIGRWSHMNWASIMAILVILLYALIYGKHVISHHKSR